MRIMTLAILAFAITSPATATGTSGNAYVLAESPAIRHFQADFGEFLRHWREDEEILGERRLRRLAVARYHLRVEDFGYSLDERPDALDETTSVLRSIVSKLIRERIEDRLFPEDLSIRRHREEPAVDTIRLRISPRVALGGSNAHLGVRLRLAGTSDPVWSRFDLGFRDLLEKPGHSVFVQYRDDERFLRLEHKFGTETGDEIAVTVRWLI